MNQAETVRLEPSVVRASANEIELCGVRVRLGPKLIALFRLMAEAIRTTPTNASWHPGTRPPRLRTPNDGPNGLAARSGRTSRTSTMCWRKRSARLPPANCSCPDPRHRAARPFGLSIPADAISVCRGESHRLQPVAPSLRLIWLSVGSDNRRSRKLSPVSSG
jgi:hypothetical protein